MIEYKSVLIASLIGILPVFAWIWLISRGGRYSWVDRKWLLRIFFWGVLTAIPVGTFGIFVAETDSKSKLVALVEKILHHQSSDLTLALVIAILVMAFSEEFFKGIAIAAAWLKSKRENVSFGIVVGVLIGLAFAVTENGVYFAMEMNSTSSTNSIFQTVLLRFILSTSAHIIYSGFFGALIGWQWGRKSFLWRFLKVLLALLIAVLIHTTFNLLLLSPYHFLTPVIILSGLALLGVLYWRFCPKKNSLALENNQ